MGKIADKIREAILGSDVREAIAEGIEETERLRDDYNAQVINAGNSNAEIVDARGGQEKLKDRLDLVDSQLAENTTVVPIPTGLTYHNYAIQDFVNTHNYVRIPKGNYIFEKVVKIPSNRTIFIDEGTTITLKDGCNEYIFENEDLVNGNENITILGGKYYGKGSTMTRKFDGATLEEDYYGFGLHFFKVKNLTLAHMYIEETNAWAIAHNLCDNVNVDDIFVWQTASLGANSDGVTGQSKNVRITNIKGYTNDDLVAFGAWGAQMGANEMKIPKQDIENYHIENVEGLARDGYYAWKGVAIYQRSGYKVNNVTVRNVKGLFEYGAVYFRGEDIGSESYFSDINLEQISGISKNPVGTVCIDKGNIKNINISNATLNRTNTYAYLVVGYAKNSIIETLTLSNISETTTGGSLIYDRGEIKNLTVSNCSRVSSTQGTIIYTRESRAGQTIIPNINMNSVKFSDITFYKPIEIKPGSLKVSLNCTEFYVDENTLTPKNKDIIFSSIGGMAYFYNSKWNYLGSFESKPFISAGLTNNFTVGQNTFTKILFDKVEFSNNLFLSSGTVTITETGYYQVIAGIATQNAGTVAQRITIAIFKNNTENVCLGQQSVAQNDYTQINGTVILKLQANDVLELRGASTSSTLADRVLSNNVNKTFFQISKL